MPTSDRALDRAPATFVVHSLDHAVAAATAAAERGRPVRLASAPGAAAYAGAAWFLALVEEARARVPAAEIEGVLDCGDDLALAIEAVHAGATHVAFSGTAAARAALESIAARGEPGAAFEIVTDGAGPADALDLQGCGNALDSARNFLA